MRVRVYDGRIEPLADLSGLNRIETYGSRELYVTPNGELLFTRDIGTQEIYALKVRWPYAPMHRRFSGNIHEIGGKYCGEADG